MNENSTALVEARTRFVNVLADCISDSVRGVLGQGTLDAVLSKMRLDQLSDSPAGIHSTFSQLFGPGAKVLEKIILKDLFRRLGLRFEELAAFDFETYANIARREYAMTMMRDLGRRA